MCILRRFLVCSLIFKVIQVVGVNTSGPSLALGTTMFLEMRVVARGEALCDAPVPGLGE